VLGLVRRLSDWLFDHPTGRWVLLGSCVGLLCGVAATIFEISADLLSQRLLVDLAGVPQQVASTGAVGATNESNAFRPLTLLGVLTGGGLLAGLIILRWSLHARGGGIGVAVHAFHYEHGHIPLALSWTKLVATIVSLGSGGSGGREGPIALVGAGFASWFASRLHLTARDRGILLVAGIAGGTAATFRAPLAAAIFAAEVLYRGPELESDVIIPCFISAVVAYLIGGIGLDVIGPLAGHADITASTLFQPGPSAFRTSDWQQLGGYSLIAVATAITARWFIGANEYVVAKFDHARLPFWIKPMLGAVGTGAVALILYTLALITLHSQSEAELGLATIGPGYGILHWLFSGVHETHHPLIIAALLGVMALGKATTTALTVGSGGSAGLFGPSIVIGGCVGGAIGLVLGKSTVTPPIAACVLMGMAGMLAATHRTPVAALLMVSEVAGTYLLLVPTMWVVGLAFLATGRRSLISGQVYAIQDSPAHRGQLFSDVLATSCVADLLIPPRAWTTIPASADLPTCRRLVADSVQDQFPVVQADGTLSGVIERMSLIKLDADALLCRTLVAEDLATAVGCALQPGDSLSVVLHSLHRRRVDELPVVDDQGRFLALITSGMLMEYYRRHMERAQQECAVGAAPRATASEIRSDS
jgi:CIC family chloride channel protein